MYTTFEQFNTENILIVTARLLELNSVTTITTQYQSLCDDQKKVSSFWIFKDVEQIFQKVCMLLEGMGVVQKHTKGREGSEGLSVRTFFEKFPLE